MIAKNSPPLISVVIPAFNDQENLIDAVACVNRQSIEDLEIIIVDDGSDVQIQVPDLNNCTVIRHDKNRGPAAARNTGMARAKGRYIAFLDSDDDWQPGKIEKQLKRMEAASGDVAGVFTPFYYLGKPDKVFNLDLQPDDWFNYLLMGCRVAPGSSLLFRRTIFEVVGPQDQELRHFEDWDWLLRSAQKFRFIHEQTSRTILKPSHRVRFQAIEQGLKYFESKWVAKLKPAQADILKAAIAIELAVTCFNQSNYLETSKQLFRAAGHSRATLYQNIAWRYFRRAYISPKSNN